MKAIEREIKGALACNSTCQLSIRDRVECNPHTNKYFLWDSNIYSEHKDLKEICFTFKGYNTNTTKSRINALLPFGSVCQKNYQLLFCLNGEVYPITEWDRVHIDTDTKKVYITSNL